MDVNNMVAAMAAKTVDAMVNVEPYNAIAEADGIATTIMDYWSVDKMPVFMAATPEFVAKSADTIVAYLKAWLEVARDFKDGPQQGGRRHLRLLHVEGLQHLAGDLPEGACHGRRRIPAFRPTSSPTCRRHAEILLQGEEDLRHPRLEQGAAAGVHGAGAFGHVRRLWWQRRRPGTLVAPLFGVVHSLRLAPRCCHFPEEDFDFPDGCCYPEQAWMQGAAIFARATGKLPGEPIALIGGY